MHFYENNSSGFLKRIANTYYIPYDKRINNSIND